MTDTIPFLPRTPSDKALAEAAKAQGLRIATDKWGRYWVSLSDPIDDGTLNPHLILAGATRDEVLDYLRKRHSQHRELTPREVLGPMRAHHSDDE